MLRFCIFIRVGVVRFCIFIRVGVLRFIVSSPWERIVHFGRGLRRWHSISFMLFCDDRAADVRTLNGRIIQHSTDMSIQGVNIRNRHRSALRLSNGCFAAQFRSESGHVEKLVCGDMRYGCLSAIHDFRT